MLVTKRDGTKQPVDPSKISRCVEWACKDLNVSAPLIIESANLQLYDGVPTAQLHATLIQAAAELVSPEAQHYTYVAARLVLLAMYKEVGSGHVGEGDSLYPTLRSYINKGIKAERLDRRLADFDLEELDNHIKQGLDFQFDFLGIQTLHDRYLVRRDPDVKSKNPLGTLLELPQHFFMRVAMGLALNERPIERTARAVEFYNVMANFEYMPSTPTLFNSGTLHPQMSSCYLNQVQDSIFEPGKSRDPDTGIFAHFTENALLSKFAGGIGSDWTPVRGAGSIIKSTGGKSSGIVPWLKIENDTAVAVNQGGKRNGAFAAYLEPWHPDALGFMDLKKKVGEPRLRAHELFTAWWIPDLFMERVLEDGVWSFFDPRHYDFLHEIWGDEFKLQYENLESQELYVSQMPAKELWRKMITSLYEEGGPWITFKDECNRRNPQQHCGVVHSSNLCTEITLNTSADETAVCNLGSVVWPNIKFGNLPRVITTAVRMLDNVIDLNFYPVEKARKSNLRHRPIGLGMMGWAEFLAKEGIEFESTQHFELVELMTEAFSFLALSASCALAAERGRYESYDDSLWSQGILPIDTARSLPGIAIADDQRVIKFEHWQNLRESIEKWGVRNSNVLAIAPTATIANIVGTTQSIEPSIDLVTQKKNLSGEFKVVCPTLRHGAGAKTAFQIDQNAVITAAAIRQRWIDQGQSVNLFARVGVSGRELSELYFEAWRRGLKTTYYLQTERVKEEVDQAPVMPPSVKAVYDQAFARMKAAEERVPVFFEAEPEVDFELGKACPIGAGPDCESCQ